MLCIPTRSSTNKYRQKPNDLSATAMHKRATAPELYTLPSGQNLQRPIESLLAVAFAFDEFAT